MIKPGYKSIRENINNEALKRKSKRRNLSCAHMFRYDFKKIGASFDVPPFLSYMPVLSYIFLVVGSVDPIQMHGMESIYPLKSFDHWVSLLMDLIVTKAVILSHSFYLSKTSPVPHQLCCSWCRSISCRNIPNTFSFPPIKHILTAHCQF